MAGCQGDCTSSALENQSLFQLILKPSGDAWGPFTKPDVVLLVYPVNVLDQAFYDPLGAVPRGFGVQRRDLADGDSAIYRHQLCHRIWLSP